MRVTSIELHNFRSFESTDAIELDQINVLIGPNNAGKTSILRAMHLLQSGHQNVFPDVRVNTSVAHVLINLSDIDREEWLPPQIPNTGLLKIEVQSSDRMNGNVFYHLSKSDSSHHDIKPLQNREPDHFILPYLSKRKTTNYAEDVRIEYALGVYNNFQFLASKLSRLSNPAFPKHETYSKTCKEILGFVVTNIPSLNGQRAGVYLPDLQTIPIDQMGEGVANIVALLADLALSSGKLFLIEEPENDLHPQALKALLDLILESSQKNQFIISTHSNIVVRHLASAENSKLYNITTEADSMPPVATIREVERTVDARLAILRDLGYSFSDFDLWDGWLILEESSAERIIRDYLIPWFAPKLARIRTVSTGGVSQVEPTFDDFNRLVRFTYLEKVYRNAVWVRVDGDKPGEEIIKRLQANYPLWDKDRFKCFEKGQFEHYYPSEFTDQVIRVLDISNKKARREAKRELLNDVRVWLDEDEKRARRALEESAKEVILHLKSIEEQLFK